MDDYLLKNKRLWGKYNAENGYHPAVYHMLDVALVAGAIFELLDSQEQKLLIGPFKHSKHPLAALQFLIALHDLGKLTPGFQLKLKEWESLLSEQGFEWESVLTDENTNHGYTGYFLLTELLSQALNLRKEAALGLANAVAGHHGSFFGAI